MNPSVLHITTTDNWGGAGRAAYRIHTGLKNLGLRSRLLVGMKITDDPDVRLILREWLRRADRAYQALTDYTGLQYLVTPSSVDLPWHRWVREADVIQLHKTHRESFSHTVLPLLAPTLSENLPNGILESMACGTPAVAFDTGGCSDAVRQLETGYLAKHGDVEDLTRGVDRLLTDAALRTALGANGRRVVEAEYGLMLQARRLATVYSDLTHRELG